MKKIILVLAVITSASMACDGSEKCKAELTECKTEFKAQITKVFECVETAKSKEEVNECHEKVEDVIEEKCEVEKKHDHSECHEQS